jgi:hypothetical protein
MAKKMVVFGIQRRGSSDDLTDENGFNFRLPKATFALEAIFRSTVDFRRISFNLGTAATPPKRTPKVKEMRRKSKVELKIASKVNVTSGSRKLKPFSSVVCCDPSRADPLNQPCLCPFGTQFDQV